MKKHPRYVPLFSAFGLAMLCLTTVVGLLWTAELLSVRAAPSDTVSPAALSGEKVTPSELTENGSRSAVSRFFLQGAVIGLLGNAAPPASLDVTVTHTRMTGGQTYQTAVPAGASLGGNAQLGTLEGDPPVMESVQPFSVKDSTFTGTVDYGKSLRLTVPSVLANGATVTATLSDASTVTWNGPAITTEGDNTCYDFAWDDLAAALGEKYVTALSVNLPYRVTVHALTVTGDDASSLVLTSDDASSAWNLLYTDDTADIVTAQTSVSADSGHTVSAYAAEGGSFLLTESGETRKITSVTGGAAERVDDYTYRVTMPSSSATLDVTTEEMPVRTLTVTASSPDYSMHAVTVMDSATYGTAYSATPKFRYSDAEGTAGLASNAGGAEGKGTVTFSNYYRMPRQDWWVSLIPYLETSAPSTSRAEYPDGAESFLEISNVRFYDAENTDITDSVAYRFGWKLHSPYVQFRPQDRDMRVTFDVTLSPTLHKVYLDISRPTTEDTFLTPWFTGSTNASNYAPVLYLGSASANPQVKGKVDYLWSADPILAGQPFLFETKQGTEHTRMMAYFKEGCVYTFDNYRSSGKSYGQASILHSANVYAADASGHKTGSSLNSTIGLAYDSALYGPDVTTDGTLDPEDYGKMVQDSSGVNKSQYNNKTFTMPDCDIVFEIKYTDSIGAWNITQQVINADGSVSDASNDFAATFSGSARTSDSKGPFFEGNNQTVTGATGTLGRYKGVNDITFTTSAPDGYRVAYVQCRTKFENKDISSCVKRTGVTGDGKEQFAFKDGTLSNYGEQYNNGNGVAYDITVQYTKTSTIHLTQRTSATVPAGSTAAIGTVTFTSDNGGSFIDASSGALSHSLPFTLTESEQSSDLYASDGNRTRFTVDVNDSGHVLSGVKVYRVLGDSSKADVPFTTVSATTSKGVYTIDSALAAGGEIFIEADYVAATRLSLDIRMKSPNDSGTNTALSNDVHATVTVTGTGATTPDYQFQSATGSATCDAFTVTDKNVGKYITVGNTKLTIAVTDLTEGYTVANVILYEMNASTGAPNTSKELEGLTPTTQTVGGYGECRSYLSSSYTMAGANVYIRVILARTVTLNVAFQSRTDADNAAFGGNTLAQADVSVMPSASTAAYGKGIMPVIVRDQMSTGFATTAITFSSDPAERTVDLVEKVQIKGTVNVPVGYMIAGMTAKRVNTATHAEETLYVELTGQYVTVGGNKIYQTSYTVKKTGSTTLHVDYGYTYDVSIQYEKAAAVRFALYHNDDSGAYTTDRIAGNQSQATLNGQRGSDDAADAPYNDALYRSENPFLDQAGSAATQNAGMAASKTLRLNVTPHDVTYYALRHTDLTFSVTPKGDDELAFIKVFNANDPTVTYEYTLVSESGGTQQYAVSLRITEKAGYVLHRLELTGTGFNKVYSRADLTANAPSETGDITLTVPLPEGFTGFEAGGSYGINADFIAEYVHVSAYAASQDDFSELLNTGVYDFNWSTLEWVDPRGTVSAGQYSVDGAQSKKYYDENSASMGVRHGSTPSFTVNPLYNSSTKTHYRIGMVLYGDTMSTQDQNRVRISSPPLANDQTLRLDFTKPVTGDRYITIVYVTFKEDDVEKPKVYTPYDTAVGNASLTVNLFLLDDDTNEYNLINDISAAVLENIKVDLTAVQKCVGYAIQDSDGSNVSNRDHHANYQVEGEPPVIYEHDTAPTVQRYDIAASAWSPIIGALADDAEYPVGSRNIAAETPYRMAGGSTLFAVKYNTVDTIDALLTTDIGEEYLLQKMIINDTTAGTPETKEFTGSQSIASTYRYRTDDHNRTINYYFRRVVMELGINHQEGVEKGSVSYVVGDGEAIAIAESDHNQALKISVGKPIKLKVKPSDGYRLFGVWAGDSIDAQQPVTDMTGPDENGVITVNLGPQYKTLYVNVRFAPRNVAGISQMVLRQYMVDAADNVTPITTGKVIATGVGTQAQPFVTSDTVTLENAQSLETDVYEDTDITFSLTPPPNGRVKELTASMQGASDAASTPLGVTNTAGNTFRLDEKTVGDKIIYVDAYFTATYTLHYDANGGLGQAPADVTGRQTGDAVTLSGEHTLNRDGYTFKGWSLSSDNDESKIIASVTFADADITVYAVWAQQTCTVTYRAGSAEGVTGDAPTDTNNPYAPNAEVTVLGNGTLARANHTFLGWSETDNASAVQYAENATFAITKDTVLYPVWKTAPAPGSDVTIRYTSGLSTAEMNDPSLRTERTDTFAAGGDYTVRPNDGWTDYRRPGYRFMGWRVASVTPLEPSSGGAHAGHPASGDSALPAYWQEHSFWNPDDVMPALDENVSLTAVWERLYTVRYDGNGQTSGEAPSDDNTYADGASVTVKGKHTLEKSGCTFHGWNTAKDGSGHRYDPNAAFVIHSDVILYAQWNDPATPTTPDSPDTPVFDIPGTGESMAGIGTAFLALLGSAVTAALCIRRVRKKAA